MEITDGKKLADYIKASKNPIHLQDDGTIDILFNEERSLDRAMMSVKCPYCEINVRNTPMNLGNQVFGAYLRCPDCGQRFFIHLFVPFGGTIS